MSKKSRMRTELDSDQEAAVEKAEAAEQARRKELDVDVIHLSYRDQAGQIADVLEAIRVGGYGVDSESEEVLTVGVAPDCSVVSLRPPPGCYIRALVVEDEPETA